MLRALVLALLVANALVLSWSLGVLDGPLGRRPNADREPDRLQRQVHPELVQLLPATAASQAGSASQPSAGLPSPVAVAARCLEAGPLPASALPGAEKALQAAGLASGSWSTTPFGSKGLFLIYMGRYDDDDTLQRKLDELKRRRIEARPVRQADLQPGLEIGRFDDREEAEATLARLSQRGLRTARVVTVTASQPQVIVRVAAAEPGQASTLVSLKLAPGVEGFVACAAPGAAAPASSPAPTAELVRTSAPVGGPTPKGASPRSASAPGTPAASATTTATPAARPPPASAFGPAAVSAARPAGRGGSASDGATAAP